MSAHKLDWQELQIAYQVGLCGTLSAAAEQLGVHHSTVLRRIDSLERRLGTRLFYRHARGYEPTEAGLLMMQSVEQARVPFERLQGQLQEQEVQLSGTLVLTTVNTLADLLLPMLADFQRDYPQIRLEYVADSRIFKLEYGEAHLSIRPGQAPRDPDYVVQPLARLATTLYADAAYLARHGRLHSLAELDGHHFVATPNAYPGVPAMQWLNTQVPSEQIALRCNELGGLLPAVRAGFGAAPLNCWRAQVERGLYPLLLPPAEWALPLWLVTHRDLNRSPKVQALSRFLKARFTAEAARLEARSLTLD